MKLRFQCHIELMIMRNKKILMKHKITTYDKANMPSEEKQQAIVSFLFEHLDEYGDEKQYIGKCMDYALQKIDSPGGFVMTIEDGENVKAATIFNHTGMGGYIPENILVYIAAHGDHRGEGLGSTLMKNAIEYAKGDVALHVDKDNPAIGLYEKLGFTNPYLEMRLKR